MSIFQAGALLRGEAKPYQTAIQPCGTVGNDTLWGTYLSTPARKYPRIDMPLSHSGHGDTSLLPASAYRLSTFTGPPTSADFHDASVSSMTLRPQIGGAHTWSRPMMASIRF